MTRQLNSQFFENSKITLMFCYYTLGSYSIDDVVEYLDDDGIFRRTRVVAIQSGSSLNTTNATYTLQYLDPPLAGQEFDVRSSSLLDRVRMLVPLGLFRNSPEVATVTPIRLKTNPRTKLFRILHRRISFARNTEYWRPHTAYRRYDRKRQRNTNLTGAEIEIIKEKRAKLYAEARERKRANIRPKLLEIRKRYASLEREIAIMEPRKMFDFQIRMKLVLAQLELQKLQRMYYELKLEYDELSKKK